MSKAQSMVATSSTIDALAKRLLAFETLGEMPSKAYVDEAIRVSEKLNKPFSKLAGGAGFSSFLSRALALAKAQTSLLDELQVLNDGVLVRCKTSVQLDTEESSVLDAGLLLTEILLGLLVTFIGEPLMLTLVMDAWVDQNFDTTTVSAEEKS